MNRRQFGAAFAALGLSTAVRADANIEVEKLQLSRNGWVPNNERLPVLLYRKVFQAGGEIADRMEAAFKQNAWPAQWRNGVYSFHHYHSTAHEVLGFCGGTAKLILGGEGGKEVTVEAGDVAVLPAGTGHCRMEADEHFSVIGAYPVGQHWDICRDAPTIEVTDRMRNLIFPKSDPVSGATGPLTTAWRM